MNKQLYNESMPEFFRAFELWITSADNFNAQFDVIPRVVAEKHMQLLRKIRFEHIRMGPYWRPSDGVEGIISNLTRLILDHGLNNLHCLRLCSHYDRYCDKGENSPGSRRKRRQAALYNGEIRDGYESPIEPEGRNDKKFILMRMRRTTLFWAAGIAETMHLKVLIEEPPSKKPPNSYYGTEDSKEYKPSWFAVAMRLAKPGTNAAKLKPQVSGNTTIVGIGLTLCFRKPYLTSARN